MCYVSAALEGVERRGYDYTGDMVYGNGIYCVYLKMERLAQYFEWIHGGKNTYNTWT